LIVYQASKRQFIHDTFHDDIEFVLSQQYLRSTGRRLAGCKMPHSRPPVARQQKRGTRHA
jgi:hypothetical protein